MNIYRDIADVAALERAYSPSSCVDDLQSILALYPALSARVRGGAAGFATHAYGDDPVETLDLFRPDAADAPAPVVVYIHGGYWQELSKDEHSFPAPLWNDQGFAYAALNYGLAPASSLGQMIGRCRRAVAWIHREASRLGLDPAAIHLAGCSAGAHLAAMTALADEDDRSPIRTLTLLSGVFDLRPLPLTYVNDALRMSAQEALTCSPQLLIDAFPGELPHALLVYGAQETMEFKRQSEDFARALKRKGAQAEVLEIEGRNHFDLIFDFGDLATDFGAAVARHVLGGRDVSA